MNSANNRTTRSAFTIMELVVVIAILGVVAVIVIPAVRTLSQDRKVRDTARIVGSAFAAARERAGVDGRAGIEIVPLANVLVAGGPGGAPPPTLGYNVPNMGMLVYQLRSVPDWRGDTLNSRAAIQLSTRWPVNPDPMVNETYYTVTVAGGDCIGAGVQANDFVQFNNSGASCRIVEDPVNAPITSTTFDIAVKGIEGTAFPPATYPLLDVPLPFQVQRQPVRIESSVIRLPNNLFLNMALSGHGSDGWQFAYTGPNTPASPMPVANAAIRIWFNRDGSIDRVVDRDTASMVDPAGPVFLLMANGDGDDIDVTALGDQRFIEDDNNLWIVVDHTNGKVSISRMAELGAAGTVADKLINARALARGRRTGNP